MSGWKRATKWALAGGVLLACGGELGGDDFRGTSPMSAGSTAGTGGTSSPRNCGGEAAKGGYGKYGGTWDGSAGNPYGYPPGAVPDVDCSGFGFHDTCNFYELCQYVCQTADECPLAGDAGPAPVCWDPVKRQPGPGSCVLPCTNDATCPDGMNCVHHPYGYGQICMWLRLYGSG
jgi:hypothetical protein